MSHVTITGIVKLTSYGAKFISKSVKIIHSKCDKFVQNCINFWASPYNRLSSPLWYKINILCECVHVINIMPLWGVGWGSICTQNPDITILGAYVPPTHPWLSDLYFHDIALYILVTSGVCVRLCGVIIGRRCLGDFSEKWVSGSSHVSILAEVKHGAKHQVQSGNIVSMTSTVAILRLLVKPE